MTKRLVGSESGGKKFRREETCQASPEPDKFLNVITLKLILASEFDGR